MELFLSALCEVQALGPRRAAEDGDRWLGRVGVLVGDGRVEVFAAAGHRPGGVRITVDPKEVVTGGALNGVAEPLGTLNGALGRLFGEEANAQEPRLDSTKTRP